MGVRAQGDDGGEARAELAVGEVEEVALQLRLGAHAALAQRGDVLGRDHEQRLSRTHLLNMASACARQAARGSTPQMHRPGSGGGLSLQL